VDDRVVRSVVLGPGTVVAIGRHRLEVIEAPPGFDLALVLEADRDVSPAEFEAAFGTRLESTWLGKRAASWALAALVLTVAFVVPALVRYGGLGGEERPAGLPDDRIWTSGPLHAAHAVAVPDCAGCHVRPFEQVVNDACLGCHADAGDHVASGHAAFTMGEVRCGACHAEHEEPSRLVDDDDELCAGCHASDAVLAVSDGLGRVSGFGQGTHPDFEVSLLEGEADELGRFTWQVRRQALATAREASNLAFPHDLHLDPEKVRDENSGSTLGCTDCHTAASDGEHFVPVTMEVNCRGCHALTFDETGRQVPHGEPAEVTLTMEGHFLRAYTDPVATADVRLRRPIPDRPPRDDCKGAPFACAAARTARAAEEQFTVSGCVTCHEVETTDARDIYSRYLVRPVRLTADFMPAARFDHRAHAVLGDLTGDDACLDCHAATATSASASVMVPELTTCTQCHADRGRGGRVVPLDCVDCHAYHPQEALVR
jgi:predicted CXXCH cytochrome family protein